MTAGQASIWVDQGGGYLHHTEPNGALWTIRPTAPGAYTLTMQFRGHSLRSRHDSLRAAKRHYADMQVMFAARDASAYIDTSTAAASATDSGDEGGLF